LESAGLVIQNLSFLFISTKKYKKFDTSDVLKKLQHLGFKRIKNLESAGLVI